MNTTGTKPRFRLGRPRFGLRALFIVVTSLSLSVGWQAKIVRERREAMAKAIAAGDTFFPVDGTQNNRAAGRPIARIPYWRHLLGDVAIEEVLTDEANIDRLTRLFPEASVDMPIECGLQIRIDETLAPPCDVKFAPPIQSPSGVSAIHAAPLGAPTGLPVPPPTAQ